MEVISSKDYVEKAEEVITKLISEAKELAVKQNRRNYQILSTSQIRKQLSMTTELLSLAESESSDKLSQEIVEKIEYLRVQFVYQAGREQLVRKFVEKAGILKILKSINSNKEDFLTFCRYMEALVAFRKYHCEVDS